MASEERMTLAEFLASYPDDDEDTRANRIEVAVYEGTLNCSNCPKEITDEVERLEEYFADAWKYAEEIEDEALRLHVAAPTQVQGE